MGPPSGRGEAREAGSPGLGAEPAPTLSVAKGRGQLQAPVRRIHAVSVVPAKQVPGKTAALSPLRQAWRRRAQGPQSSALECRLRDRRKRQLPRRKTRYQHRSPAVRLGAGHSEVARRSWLQFLLPAGSPGPPNGWRFSCGERAPPQMKLKWFRSVAAGNCLGRGQLQAPVRAPGYHMCGTGARRGPSPATPGAWRLDTLQGLSSAIGASCSGSAPRTVSAR